MKKIYLFITVMAILTAGCTMNVKGIEEYAPVLTIDASDTLRFTIDAGEDNEWGWEDSDTVLEDIIITETEGNNAYITSVSWRIEDYEGRMQENGEHVFTSPLKLPAGKSDTLELEIMLRGHDAQDIDESDGNEDSVARGIIKFSAEYYDELSAVHTTKYFYSYITAVK
ncbi:MAG: hypothetical protein R6U31_06360 [bacterium]